MYQKQIEDNEKHKKIIICTWETFYCILKHPLLIDIMH